MTGAVLDVTRSATFAPSAAAATHVLVAPVDGPALYDSMVAPIADASQLAALPPEGGRVDGF